MYVFMFRLMICLLDMLLMLSFTNWCAAIRVVAVLVVVVVVAVVVFVSVIGDVS